MHYTNEVIINFAKTLSYADLTYYHGTYDEESDIVLALMSILDIDDFDEIPEAISSECYIKLKDAVEKRISTKMPMAYIVDNSYLAGYRFFVNQNVMIPTSPIAFLLKDMLKPWVKPENINSILDLCTGSAALSIIATKVFNPNLSEAVDICENALTVARDNISKHDVNINLIQSDLFNNVVNKYDLIISNPPYVSKTSYDSLPHEFTFEPKKAFISDNKGLDIPLRIICESINFLNDDGVLLLEVGESDYLLESYINQPILWLDTGNSACGVCLFNKKELIRIEKKIRLNNKGI